MSTKCTIASNAKEGWHLFKDLSNDMTSLEWTLPPLEFAVPIPDEAIEALERNVRQSAKMIVREETERLQSELETERGQRQADNKESQDDVDRLRKLLTELVESSEGIQSRYGLRDRGPYRECAAFVDALATAKEAL